MSSRHRLRGLGFDLACSVAVALVVVGPLLIGRGFWLVGDMVFVPRQPWKADWLGLGGALPRAVPMDAMVSAASAVLPGEVVQRVLLLAAFMIGGGGAGALVRRLGFARWPARTAAVLITIWNPWVAERLLMGQWAILAGGVALPGVAAAAIGFASHPSGRSRIRLWAIALVAAACSPSTGVFAILVVGVATILTSPRCVRWRTAAVALAVAVAANLPWIVPALTARQVDVTTNGVFAAFAARAESAAGVWPSLLSLGGTWKSSIVPAERTQPALVLLSCLLTVAALAGVVIGYRCSPRRRPALVAVAGLGLVGLVLAALPTAPWGATGLEAVAARVPAIALLRDSQRALALLVLPMAVGVAAMATWLIGRVGRGREALAALVGLLVAAPVLLLPGLAWGVSGGLQRSQYPAEWDQVAAMIDSADTTVVVPWTGNYRGFAWNHHRAVLDPAARFFRGEVVSDDRVVLAGTTVPSEDPRVRAVAAALPDGSRLRALGVRFVLVEKGMPSGTAPHGRIVHDGPGLRLIDLGPATGAGPGTRGPIVPFIVSIGWIVAFGLPWCLGRVKIRCG